MNIDTIREHCAAMAQHDRDYATWAWRTQYPAMLPCLFERAPARAFAPQEAS